MNWKLYQPKKIQITKLEIDPKQRIDMKLINWNMQEHFAFILPSHGKTQA